MRVRSWVEHFGKSHAHSLFKVYTCIYIEVKQSTYSMYVIAYLMITYPYHVTPAIEPPPLTKRGRTKFSTVPVSKSSSYVYAKILCISIQIERFRCSKKTHNLILSYL